MSSRVRQHNIYNQGNSITDNKMRDVALSGLDSCLFQRQVIETTLEPHPELTTHVQCSNKQIASLSHRLAEAAALGPSTKCDAQIMVHPKSGRKQ